MKPIDNAFLIPLFALLTACSSVPLAEVDTEDLKVGVNLLQERDKTRLDVKLHRGIWNQAVTADPSELIAMTESGEILELNAANRKGQYGFIERPSVDLAELKLGPLPSIEFPAMSEVHLTGKDAFEGQLFFRDDVLTLALPASVGEQRFLLATGRCGSTEYHSRLKISSSAHRLEIRLASVMDRINAVAEADLAGIIPIELAVEEHYQARWPQPYTEVELRSRDSAEIQLDTSGFRFKADLRIKLGSNAFLSLQNQPWPTRYCF